jgi:hypothetical protein
MSSITPIVQSLPGERVLDVSPAQDAVASATTWLRRPNMFAGRALTATTLEAQSDWLAGRVATRGQAFTPGVVRGLQVEYRTVPAVTEAGRRSARLLIASGQALTISGETITIGEIDASLDALHVVAPPEVLQGGNFGGGGVLQPRQISSNTLGNLYEGFPDTMPLAGILVLQPVVTQRSNLDPNDPCDRCGCDGAVDYEDWRYADAARLLWYAWPSDWAGAPPSVDDPQRRNRMAYRIFDAERVLAPDEIMPWEHYGVPIALVGLGANMLPAFVDHAAVVRQGGRGRYSRICLSSEANDSRLLQVCTQWRSPMLWQAQFDQLAEHIASEALHAERNGDPIPTAAQLATQFDRLPPCGLLPADAVDVIGERKHTDFFRNGMDIDAVPVPLDQLDTAIRETAGLAPFDIAQGERVRILVPVSQASYEPRLLKQEEIDGEFDATLQRFIYERSVALAGRQSLRMKATILAQALRGVLNVPLPAPIDADPQALEPERQALLAKVGVPSGSIGHRTIIAQGLMQYDATPNASKPVSSADALYAWVYLDPDAVPRTLMMQWTGPAVGVRAAYWGEDLIDEAATGVGMRVRIGEMPQAGRWHRLQVPAASLGLGDPSNNSGSVSGMRIHLYDGRVAFASFGKLVADQEQHWFEFPLRPTTTDPSSSKFELIGPEEALLSPFEENYGVGAKEVKNGNGVVIGIAIVNGAFDALKADPAITDTLSDKEVLQLDERGIDGFIEFLKNRADRADDIVDYSFVKVQTDLYRVRQIMLGTTEASRLAISPALASIAQAETAVATQASIRDFITRTKISARVDPIERTAQPAPDGLSARSVSAAPSLVAESFQRGGDALVSKTVSPTTDGIESSSRAVSGATASFGFVGGGLTATSFLTDPDRLSVIPSKTIEPKKLTPLTPLTPVKPTYTPGDIVGANPLSGSINLRTLSLAERMKLSESERARDYSTSTRHETVMALIAFADQLTDEDGGVVPGLFENIDVWGLKNDEFLKEVQPQNPQPATPPVLKRSFKHFLDKSKRNALLGHLLLAPELQQADEGAYFSDGVDMADRTIALFRQVEGRIRSYRALISKCEAARDTIRGQLLEAGARERVWNDRLAEARHDVSVTRALIVEEQARIDAVNERRRKVLTEEVRFVAYIRPRSVDNLLATPSRTLDPGLLEAPAPACLKAHADVPDELVEMLAVLREAPAVWFIAGPALLDRLNRLDLMAKTVQAAQVRSLIAAQRIASPAIAQAAGQGGRFGAAITKVRTLQSRVVDDARAVVKQIDITRFASMTWQSARQEAAQVVSLGDIIDGDHGQGALARNAVEFFDKFSHICGCLHTGFSEVLPSIRLDWAETISQFDDAPNLRNLAVLQRWSEIDFAERRRMQGLVDWLFDQLDTGEARAVGLVNDIVRMCLLLASHAPVGRIIAGRLPRAVTARPGVRIPLVALDVQRLRVGMHALVYRAESVVARAVVEDIGGGEVAARVLHTEQTSVELDTTMRVQFADASSISLAGKMKSTIAALGKAV